MRLSRRLASTTVAVALVLPLSYDAIAHARVHAAEAEAEPEELFGAACRIRVTGSHVTAYCHNPYPETDRVSLHVECARWWDLDSDGSAVDAGPAQTVRLTGRCWKEVASVWVSHQQEG
ncbi:hypothetical protein ACM01_44695 [Streptomyces viridochromogenes]|uniref:Secreted protein n=1 Tax=Streptomyces viridochromogenes TaxID=1938 RepID=A0A0J8BMQ5_STRVR|nr:hypothetical protein [Streptomyces viridochromogenes]KMS66880.1 hypothetical protein ACM01_44695 [Streptomyces viridochromogenes]KOG25903.1 hypothetical protein ADK36_04700 [Streptomyces viridochromogenes]KOG26721.1 hypothetical protein ADK35_06495 [Streptomyces viridochromogenes]